MEVSNPLAKTRYEQLMTKREPYLRRARRCSELTLPTLIPPESAGDNWDPPTPYQSVGWRGVQNLSAKLLLALLPTNTSFFRLVVDVFELKKIEKDQNLKSALDEALSEIEQAVMTEIETSAARTTAFEAIQHLVVGGNALLYIPDDGNLKMYRLDRYVVERDPMGHPLTIIVFETVAPDVLPENVRKAVSKESKDKLVNLYTVCERDKKEARWDVWQEAAGIELPGSRGWYPADKCPFIPLRFIKVDSEDYGRGYVEGYLGDLVSLEALSGALVDGGIAASKLLFLVNPNGNTDAKRLAKAHNGAFVDGRKEDVNCLQLDKYADFNFVFQQAQQIEKRMEQAFLLTSAVQRDAERVTAEEIRALIQELETSLGGIYSVLSQDFQLPLAVALMNRMSKDKRLPAIPKKIVRPTVTTGIEALGRGNDLQKLQTFLGVLQQTLGPQVAQQYIFPSEAITRVATALAISTKGLIRTEEDVQASIQQQQQNASMQGLAEKLGPEALRQMGAATQQQPTNG